MQKGSCLCQSVTFEVDGDIPHPVACHCTMCRKISGHFWAATGFKREKLKLTGEENLTWFQSSENVRRGFCKNCGSALFFDATDTPWISVAMGAFDSPTSSMLGSHIYVADKGDYYDITDGLPQHEGSP